jgi:hypothetical protein
MTPAHANLIKFLARVAVDQYINEQESLAQSVPITSCPKENVQNNRVAGYAIPSLKENDHE